MEGVKGIGRYDSVFIPYNLQPEYSVTDNDIGTYEPSDEIEYGDGFEVGEAEYMRLNNLSLNQMKWRRDKIAELRTIEKFRLEYPLTVNEAFSAADITDMIIKPSVILRARKRPSSDIDAPLILGVDPASGGGDKFAIVGRRGNQITYHEARNDLDPTEATWWLRDVIDELNPDRVNIDNGNLGAMVISTLRSHGDKYSALIRAVNFGGTSQAKIANPKKAGAVNRRAEMYDRFSKWLTEEGVIPDDDNYCSQLEANRIKIRDNNDWLLMSKKELKKLGIKSPDSADATALTFAYREHFDTWNNSTQPTKRLQEKNKADTYNPYIASLGANSWMGI